MDDILFEILKLVVMICSALITAFVIPYIRKTVGEKNLDEIAKWAERTVLFAQQTMSALPGSERKSYVVGFLSDIAKEKKIDITSEQIDILVESAVKSMHIETDKGQVVKISAEVIGDDGK